MDKSGESYFFLLNMTWLVQKQQKRLFHPTLQYTLFTLYCTYNLTKNARLINYIEVRINKRIHFKQLLYSWLIKILFRSLSIYVGFPGLKPKERGYDQTVYANRGFFKTYKNLVLQYKKQCNTVLIPVGNKMSRAGHTPQLLRQSHQLKGQPNCHPLLYC